MMTASRFVMQNALTDIQKKKKISELSHSSGDFLPSDEVACSDVVEECLSKVQKVDALNFRSSARTAYLAACRHIEEKSLGQSALQHFRCLRLDDSNPETRTSDFVKIVGFMPFRVNTEAAIDEWNLLQLEPSLPKNMTFSED